MAKVHCGYSMTMGRAMCGVKKPEFYSDKVSQMTCFGCLAKLRKSCTEEIERLEAELAAETKDRNIIDKRVLEIDWRSNRV